MLIAIVDPPMMIINGLPEVSMKRANEKGKAKRCLLPLPFKVQFIEP